MSFVYIKGTPGAGKTTLCKELQRRGYEAHDADDSDMGGPYNNLTKQRVEYPDHPTLDWYERHSYLLIPEAVESLKRKSKNKTIFLCGTSSNEDDFWHLFDKVIFLNVDEQTIRHRIANRIDNNYGKATHELNLIIEKFHADCVKKHRKGVVSVDATQALKYLTDNMLTVLKLPSNL